MIDVGSSMVGDTSPATSNQKRDLATSVRGPIIEDDVLSIDVGNPVTWDTTLTVIVSRPVVKVIALTTSSSGLVIEPLVPTALVLSHHFDDLLENFLLVTWKYFTNNVLYIKIFTYKIFYI